MTTSTCLRLHLRQRLPPTSRPSALAIALAPSPPTNRDEITLVDGQPDVILAHLRVTGKVFAKTSDKFARAGGAVSEGAVDAVENGVMGLDGRSVAGWSIRWKRCRDGSDLLVAVISFCLCLRKYTLNVTRVELYMLDSFLGCGVCAGA